LLEQLGEGFGAGGLFADDDAAGVQVVVEGLAFTQEFGGEDEVLCAEGCAGADGIADRDGGFDDHHRLWVDGDDVTDHRLDGLSVEVIGLGVVVCRRGDDDVVRADVGLLFIERCVEVERLVLKEIFDLCVFDRRFLSIQHRHLLGNDVEADYFVVLRQQHAIRQANIPGSGNGDFHCEPAFTEFISAFKASISA